MGFNIEHERECFTFPFFCSWLKEWKLRADREERKKQKDKKQEEGSIGKKNKYSFSFLTLTVDLSNA